MTPLTPAQRRALRARAHALHPIVTVGAAGLTDAVLKEIDRALNAHELVKVRMLGHDRAARAAAMERICLDLDAAPVQSIGRILIVFRSKPEPAQESGAKPTTVKKAAGRSTGTSRRK